MDTTRGGKHSGMNGKIGELFQIWLILSLSYQIGIANSALFSTPKVTSPFFLKLGYTLTDADAGRLQAGRA